MQNITFNKFIKEKKILVYFILYITLILGFIFNENTTGGALVDYKNQKLIVSAFAHAFKNSFFNFDNYITRHSPILIIFLSGFQKIGFDDNLIRLLHLHLSLLLPLIFYLILVKKFGKEKKWIYTILVSLIFLSPTFRTLAIWPDSRLFGLIFFSISILYYLKFEEKNKFKHTIKCIIFYAISAYFSPNFSVFSIFFMFKFFSKIKFFSKKNLILFAINIFLSLPAIYYIFILDVNFINKSAAIGLQQEDNILFVNFYNNILITFSMIFFYLIPFIITKIINYSKIFTFKNVLLATVIFLILIINFNYDYNLSGGGIVLRFSNLVFNNNILFFVFCFFSIIFLISIINFNFFNILLLVLIILNNPQYTIYHKYFDPFLIICFFSVFNFKIILNNIYVFRNILFINFYFLTFLIFNSLRFLWNT